MADLLHFTLLITPSFQKMQRNSPRAFNPITLRKAKIVYNFGLSQCNMVYTVYKRYLTVTDLLHFMLLITPSFHKLQCNSPRVFTRINTVYWKVSLYQHLS